MSVDTASMTYKQLIAYFGGLTKTAQALDLSKQRIHGWGKRNKIPPHRQVQIEQLTAGGLRADREARLEARRIAAYVQGLRD